jgi:cytochrome c oxidase cbb3-type subunit 3
MNLKSKDMKPNFKSILHKITRVGGFMLLLWLGTGIEAFAQEAAAPKAPSMSQEEIILLTLISAVIFLIILVLITVMYTLVVIRQVVFKEIQGEEVEDIWTSLDKNLLTRAVPIEQEKDILLDHNYDGIRELDNHLPPWWVYLFYGTIAFAIIYMFNYHVLNISPLSIQEYDQSMQAAAIQVAEYKKTQANNIDETNVAFVKDDKAAIEAGKALFVEHCVVCHGQNLEGGTGPNLIDTYWIHGGDVVSVFKTIKYGVAQKGMISWEKKLKPDEMQNVSSYILTLQGTRPINAKEAQGDEYEMGEDGTAKKK